MHFEQVLAPAGERERPSQCCLGSGQEPGSPSAGAHLLPQAQLRRSLDCCASAPWEAEVPASRPGRAHPDKTVLSPNPWLGLLLRSLWLGDDTH